MVASAGSLPAEEETMTAPTPQRTLTERMVGAALLNGDVYEEVEHDSGATLQAALIVILGAIAAGIGALGGGAPGLAVGIITALIGWGVYAYVAYWVGTNWFRAPTTSATWGELLRTLGFANTPRILLVIGIIPIAGVGLGLIVMLWTLAATVVAIRHALDFDLGAAIMTALASWLVLVVVSFVLPFVVALFV
jgi:hypothetical protein